MIGRPRARNGPLAPAGMAIGRLCTSSPAGKRLAARCASFPLPAWLLDQIGESSAAPTDESQQVLVPAVGIEPTRAFPPGGF